MFSSPFPPAVARYDSRMTTPIPRSERVLVPDVLRGVAILAMLIAHAAPAWQSRPGVVRFVAANISDLASPLFALVMGLSAQLLLKRVPIGRRGRMILQQFARGLVLIALGVWMSTWGTWVAIVLSFLGVLLIVGGPFVLLRTRWVAVAAVVLVVVSDPINAWARENLNAPSPVGDVLQWIVLSPTYRLTNLLPFFLLGVLLARHGFRRDRLLWTMLAIAPIAYLVRPAGERLWGWPDVSGSYADTLHDVGLVFLVYVIVVLLAGVKAVPWRRIIGGVFGFMAATGQVALSLYLLHSGILWLWRVAGWHRFPDDPLLLLIIVPGTLVIGWLWWRYVGTGPVEWLMGAVTGRRKPLRIAQR